jgi:hypothetical protein
MQSYLLFLSWVVLELDLISLISLVNREQVDLDENFPLELSFWLELRTASSTNQDNTWGKLYGNCQCICMHTLACIHACLLASTHALACMHQVHVCASLHVRVNGHCMHQCNVCAIASKHVCACVFIIHCMHLCRTCHPCVCLAPCMHTSSFIWQCMHVAPSSRHACVHPCVYVPASMHGCILIHMGMHA